MKMPLTTINVVDLLPNLALNPVSCPSIWSSKEFIRCDISFPFGNYLRLKVDYGDGTSYTFNPIGIHTLYIYILHLNITSKIM